MRADSWWMVLAGVGIGRIGGLGLGIGVWAQTPVQTSSGEVVGTPVTSETSLIVPPLYVFSSLRNYGGEING